MNFVLFFIYVTKDFHYRPIPSDPGDGGDLLQDTVGSYDLTACENFGSQIHVWGYLLKSHPKVGLRTYY